MPDHLERLEALYGGDHPDLFELLDESLAPRGPGMLPEVAARYVRRGGRLLDIGCRDGRHLVPLVRDHGLTGVGLDPLERHLERARAAAEDAGVDEQVELVRGVMERIEQPDEWFDLVWCRDVLEHVEDVDAGFAEVARVLKPTGHVVLYTVFRTELDGSVDARLREPLGTVAASMDQAHVEGAIARAGLAVEVRDVIGTEWREHDEERDQPVSRDLLRLARLRRQRESVVARFGQEQYEIAEASLHWLTHVLMGKLQPVLYVLTRS